MTGMAEKPISISEIRARLGGGSPEAAPGNSRAGEAAVAMIFAGEERALDLCVIRRAEREGDPWSGHMALPGGRADESDATLRAAAVRETMEEVGVELRDSHYVAPLARLPVHALGADTGIVLFPFVFYLGERRAPLVPNREVAGACWVPLGHIMDGRNGAQMPLRRGGELLHFPSVRYRGHYIWGLTYRVLERFAGALGRRLPGPPEHNR